MSELVGKQTIIYNNGEIELKVSVDSETVWLNRQQMAKLFDRDVKTIGKHINNVFKEGELEKNSTVANFATVQNEGGREVIRDIEYYNLDVIISVGYRVKSKRGVQFRQWATKVLKQYIINGYAINAEKITVDRFLNLEKDVNILKNKVNTIYKKLEDKTLQPKQLIYYDNSYYEAYKFIIDLIKSAKKSLTLIDNYINDTTLTMLSNNQFVDITIITHTISKQLKLSIEKYNKQYKPLKVITNKTFHDRYLIIDKTKVYNIGASLKDAGNKTFSINLMSDFNEDDIIKKGFR